MVTGIAETMFESREHQEYWIVLLGVESRYQGTAKSSAGAVGIGQLMPAYKQDFGRPCGLSEVDRADLDDDYTNATLSACYFKWLIEQNAGNVPLALVSYNAGLYSNSLASAKRGGSPAQEPAAYVAKIVIQKEQTK